MVLLGFSINSDTTDNCKTKYEICTFQSNCCSRDIYSIYIYIYIYEQLGISWVWLILLPYLVVPTRGMI